ncbi:MAG: TonB-dependent receptor plug domain-containing protein [Chitinophagales bacterium]|nr:TonB-dependent receptor plug domain-containing protein [Bacteroidota bacterium]MCB9042773.1 TonB-dependent receptor plug domain-containing protein [Chitinophagales bacterium]
MRSIFRFKCLWLIIATSANVVTAQNDSLQVQLPLVFVNDNRYDNLWENAATQILLSPETQNFGQAQNFSDFLTNQTAVFVKNYGLGSLSTLNINGAAANQTNILWNGFPLQSPMNGVIDLQLISLPSLDEIMLNTGNNSSFWGAGSIGGALLLNNLPNFSTAKPLQATFSYSSANEKSLYAKTRWTNQKLAFDATINFQQSRNDFRFYHRFDKTYQRQTHANYRFFSSNINFYAKIGAKTLWKNWFWWQTAQRNIPPTLLESQSAAKQSDKNIRYGTEIAIALNHKLKFSQRAAIFSENIHYRDSLKTIDAPNSALSAMGETSLEYAPSANTKIRWSGEYLWQQAKVKNYAPTRTTRHTTTTMLQWQQHFLQQKLRFDAGSRLQWVNAQKTVFVPTVNVYFSPKKIQWWAKYAQAYRLPTFNDLFWEPGGNENLLPEKSWDTQLGFTLPFFGKKISAQQKFYLFYGQSTDLIIWLPENTLYTAQNIGKVRRWGANYHLEISFFAKDSLRFGQISLNHAFVKTQDISYDAKNDRQLIYQPQNITALSLKGQWQKWRFWLRHHITDKRFTTTDNLQYLAAYQTTDLGISRRCKYKSLHFSPQIEINNLWNASYEIIAYRPMPARWFLFKINFAF